ncbi:MAG: S8 family serine peptidase, partial [Oscillospiraceae bacterium]|nr:S8 family serine peptidase [Oscillospiraceae bacterium]
MKLCKRLIAVLLVAAMLYTMVFSALAAPAAGSENISEPAGFSSATGKTITVNASENDAWTKVAAGETYASGGEDGFTYTGNSDVWINAEPVDTEEQISFADIFDFEPDAVETVEGEGGVTYTVRTYSSAESVEKLNKAFAAFNEDLAETSDDNTCIVEQYAADELVDVIVVLEEAPVAETMGISLGGLEQSAVQASNSLKKDHVQLLETIAKKVDSFELKYEYTLLLNGFAGRMMYGELEALNRVDGVKYAFVAPEFLPTADEVVVLDENDAAWVSQSVDSGAIRPAMENAGDDMNTDAAWLQGYDGAGMTVAVIDTGIDLDHVMLSVDPEDPALDLDDIKALMEKNELHAEKIVADVTAEQLYTSSKIPFGFDYAEMDASADDEMGHGTHVAGIIGAVTTTNLKHTYGIETVGVAPNAQLLAMKVFNSTGTASMTAVTAALEDAIMLGVDAANLSLGVSCGSVTAYPEITAVFNSALEAGLNVCVAAGNDATTTLNSLWNNDLGITENPDIGTLGMPATFDAPLTVASADNSTYLAGFSSSRDRLEFNVGHQNYVYAFSDKSPFQYRFGNVLGGKDYEYVTLDTGAEADYENVDVTGKLVLAKLSDDLTINQQSKIAADHGAVGLILYPADSSKGSFTAPDTTHDEYNIPVAGMAYFYGNKLATEIIPETVEVLAYWIDRPDGNQISSFSSWGTTNELTLKPEITGIGGSVLSSYKGNAIAISSGTSMASPAVCGVAVLVRQYLKEKYSLSGKELALVTDALLMSSADPITDVQSNLPFSPRAQGAGLVNAGNAIAANAYIDADGSNKAKFELGDDKERTGVYSFSFDVVNLASEKKTYSLNVLTMTESAVGGRVNPDLTYEYLMEQFAYELEPTVDAPETVTVAANGRTHVEVTITLSEDDVEYLEKYFPNGIYIEGFVTLDSTDGVDLSAPFMGFYGDWTDAPAIETNFYWDWPSERYPANTTLMPNTIYTYDETGEYVQTWYLGDTRSGNGQTHYGVQWGSRMMYWDERNAISPNGDGVRDYLEVATSLLRSVKEYRYIITDAETGEELYRKEMGYVPKAYYNSNYESILTAGMYADHAIDFDWTSLENYQKVIVRMEAVADIEGNEKVESWEFPVVADYDAPVSTIRLWMYSNKHYFQNQIRETRFVDYTDLYGIRDDGDTTRYKVVYGGYYPAGREENATWSFSNRVTEVVSMTMDYAGNTNYLYVTLSEKENMVELDAEQVNLIEGSTLQINQLYQFDTNTSIDCALTWTSSDESVVSIDESDMEHAVVTAKSVGTATITATNAFNVSDSVVITVVAEDDENYAVVAFDAGTYGTLSGKASMVVPVGYVISESDVPSVQADIEHIFKCWNVEPVGYIVKDDVTFTAKYRRNVSLEKCYIQTDTIVPGEEYLIVAEYNGGVYAMNNSYHIANVVALKGTEVKLSKVDGQYAIVKDGLENCEWTFSTETGGKIQHVATGKYLSTVYDSGFAWLGTSSSDSVTWTWDNAGNLRHDDAGAGEYTHVSYGISTSGYPAGFDLFPVDDSEYITIKLYKHVEREASAKYTVTFVDGVTGETISTQEVDECLDATLPEAPQHEGYTFLRWDDDGKFITDNLTITAEYAINSYKVTFVDGVTNAILSEQVVVYGTAAEAPAYVEHEGHTFAGWSADYSKITGDTTITANYTLNTYVVRFLDWDGTVLSEQTVSYGFAAEAPANPERARYTFLCWDTDFSRIVRDTDVTAVYVQNEVDNYYSIVVIRSEGGTVEGPEQVLAGENATFTITPDEGYLLVDVLVDGESVGAVTSYTFENVQKGHYIMAEFHTHSYTAVVTPPTCTEGGYTTWTCACGDSYVDTYTEALGHTEELTGATQPTCTEDGYTGDVICTVCGEMLEQGEAIPATGHTTELANVKNATCTEDGYTGDLVCTVCGETVEQGEAIPALGHSFGEWTVSVEADCINEGEEIRTCAVCGETETRAIPVRTDCPSDAFNDLDKTQWYHEGVDFVLDEGLMKGMSDTEFAPNGDVTRAQLVTILYRLEGQPSIEGLENPFEDVVETDWFYDAVVWAASEGVVNGT